jgi:aldehyde:ferredoxin oxidoreductase
VNATEKMAARLTLLQGVNISPADLETIANEIEDNQRIVAELEAFAQGTPWISFQTQLPEKKG